MTLMRTFISILLFVALCSACVKKPTTSPVPKIWYDSFKAWRVNNSDTAVMVLGYEDGDGDIFRDQTSHGPNLIGTFYYLNSVTKKFTAIKDHITNDTARITQTILQPVDAGYKGKSVQGKIYLPMSEFRSGDSVKIFMYHFFIEDEAGHKSNLISTDTLKVNF